MIKRFVAVAASLALIASSALAATLGGIQGQVTLNTGAGPNPVTAPTQVKPGDRVSVGPNSTAQIVYDNGCFETIQPNQTAIVKANPVCQQATQQGGPSLNTQTVVIGGLVIAGVVGGVIALSNSGGKSKSP